MNIIIPDNLRPAIRIALANHIAALQPIGESLTDLAPTVSVDILAECEKLSALVDGAFHPNAVHRELGQEGPKLVSLETLRELVKAVLAIQRTDRFKSEIGNGYLANMQAVADLVSKEFGL